jgi:pseudaminic acid biosynthesis-associated methylase
MGKQLDAWQGRFGAEYTDRNAIDWRVRLPAFWEMVGGLDVRRVLEVGCNRGHNLVALRKILGDEAELAGVEPNPHALELARATGAAEFHGGTVYELPFADGSSDLVFTAGVLIHIPPEKLPAALAELHRCSRRYLLAVEYAAEEETVVPYRGHGDLLWKRDFLKEYQTHFSDLRLVRQGFWGKEHGFDRTTWWLLEKAAATVRKAA